MAYSFRTLNYLGSKLRLLDFLESNISKVTKDGEGVCDLFAGSGCVSYRLSEKYPVVACDIQEYSRTICNALLCQYNIDSEEVTSFFDSVLMKSSLLSSFQPVIELEEKAIHDHDLNVLTAFLEGGSVEVYRLEKKVSSISGYLSAVVDNLERNGLCDEKSLISRYYGGVYFSYRQAVWIDVILTTIYDEVSEEKRDLYLAALLSTSSDLAGTVGKHFAQPIKARDAKGRIKSTVYNKAVKDKTIDALDLYKDWLNKYVSLSKGTNPSRTFAMDYLACLNNLPDSVRTVYADPPYTRDHYSRFYHVLETITRRDCPELSTTKIHGGEHVSNGLYREDRHQSPFCIRSKAPDAFKQMFSTISRSGRNLLLSYSPYDETKKTHPRVVTMQQLLTWANDYFTYVDVVSAGSFKHNKLNSTDHILEASEEAEVLIICTNTKQ